MVKTIAMCLCLLCGAVQITWAQSYDEYWKEIEKAQRSALPQTVLKLTEEVRRKALKEHKIPQLLRATICRNYYSERLTPDSLYTHLAELEQWVAKETDQVNRAILHSLLAGEYSLYMLNHYRPLQALTQLSEKPHTTDIREWSLNQLTDTIEVHVQASLRPQQALLKTSAKEYVPFTILEEDSRYFRHDLYHLLANRALNCYDAVQNIKKDETARLNKEQLYNSMLQAYGKYDSTRDALLLVELSYLDWKYKFDATAYLQKLDTLMTRFAESKLCAEIYIRKVRMMDYGTLASQGEILRLCDEGLKRYPKYKRIDELRNIQTEIQNPRLQLRAWDGGYPGEERLLTVYYANIKGITLNLYKTDLTALPNNESKTDLTTVKRYGEPVFSQHYTLRPQDLEKKPTSRTSYLWAEDKLSLKLPEEVGYYILQAVPDDSPEKAIQLFFSVSRLKVLYRSLNNGKTFFWVRDAQTGAPVVGAELDFYDSNKNLIGYSPTGNKGVTLSGLNKKVAYFSARKGDDVAIPLTRIYKYDKNKSDVEGMSKQVMLLTDRSVYRPGQSVYVKGIVYKSNACAAEVLEGQQCEVVLRDVNNKELARKTVVTNEFGSFNVDFVLPERCLNGRFKVAMADDSKRVSIAVEEYKRPTFEVLTSPIRTSYRLGDTLVLDGEVRTYSEMAFQHQLITYEVYSSCYVPRKKVEYQTVDSVFTDGNGCFKLAIPLSKKNNDSKFYDYNVKIKVVDALGEAHMNEVRFFVADKAFKYCIDLPDIQCKEQLKQPVFNIKNMNFNDMDVTGVYKIYPIKDIDVSQLYQPEGKPLIILDGKICNDLFDKDALSSKDVVDIKVLKGTAAVDKYGQQSVGGAIEITTTKQGKTDLGEPILVGDFRSGKPADIESWKKLPSGKYKVVLFVKDEAGIEESSNERCFSLFSKEDKKLPFNENFFYYVMNDKVDKEHPAVVYVGTSLKDVYLIIDQISAEHRIQVKEKVISDTLMRIVLPYCESRKDNYRLCLDMFKNRARYGCVIDIKNRVMNRDLELKWSVFRDKLLPGQQEKWQLTVKNPTGEPIQAEMLALMHDASLDGIKCYSYSFTPNLKQKWIPVNGGYTRYNVHHINFDFAWDKQKVADFSFDWLYQINTGWMKKAAFKTLSKIRTMDARVGASSGNSLAELNYVSVEEYEECELLEEKSSKHVRSNFNETAFFYPHLCTNERGEIVFSFTMPQSLTRWNFYGFAHTKEMLTGVLKASAYTSKEFMLQPNMPRYIRVGDKSCIAASVANLTTKQVKGEVTFVLFDPFTDKTLMTLKKPFEVKPEERAILDFNFEVTDEYDLLGVKIVADGGNFSDGEQHLLPVLSNTMYVTETIPLHVNGNKEHSYDLCSLFNDGDEKATNRRLTVDVTANPTWYAMMALPAMANPDCDNALSWAVAYYANALAAHLAQVNPQLKVMLEACKKEEDSSTSLFNQLEKNPELKSILLAETPWVTDAAAYRKQYERLVTLFDVNHQNANNYTALGKLRQLQQEDGAWCWFMGMSSDYYITYSIVEMMIRLQAITGVPLSADVETMCAKAFKYLSKYVKKQYLQQQRDGVKVEKTILTEAVLNFLYLVAIGDLKVDDEYKEAYYYFMGQVPNELYATSDKHKARAIVILHRAGRVEEASLLFASLKEHLTVTDEMGAHFTYLSDKNMHRTKALSTHVAAMEAIDLVGNGDEVNARLLELMKLWLLKQKQTQAWTTPLATVDAVYALLCRGTNLLEDKGNVTVSIGNAKRVWAELDTSKEQTGRLSATYGKESKLVKAKNITIKKQGEGSAWGAVYAQYLIPIAEMKQQGGALNVKKELYVRRKNVDGIVVLEPIKNSMLHVGDEVVSRLIVTLDRDMDYLHLKDARGACFEPMNSNSGYRLGISVCYYEEVKDAGVNLFFNHLSKGVYIVEHSYRVVRSGEYESGVATISSAYAPEFTSHTAGEKVRVLARK